VDRIVALADAAPGSRPAQAEAEACALRREWVDVTDFFGDVDPYNGPFAMSLFKACEGVLWEYADDANRYEGASAVTEGALDYEDTDGYAETTRLPVTFTALAEQERQRPPSERRFLISAPTDGRVRRSWHPEIPPSARYTPS
jgi:hypothetical protein